MFEWNTYFFGCLGASAPEILRLFKARNHKVIIRRPVQYTVISILFVLLGGFVAVALGAKAPHAAFYIGLSLPTIISMGGSKSIKSNLGSRRSSGVIERDGDININSNNKRDNVYATSLREYLHIIFL